MAQQGELLTYFLRADLQENVKVVVQDATNVELAVVSESVKGYVQAGIQRVVGAHREI